MSPYIASVAYLCCPQVYGAAVVGGVEVPLYERLNVDCILLYGHSMGGAVAAELVRL